MSGEGAKTPTKRRISDLDLMKERYSKLLLGEDMSGGGKGVSSALALSNAITNLAASVFGEQRKLEPMETDRKLRWKKEADWFLSVTDYIVEFVASQQKSKDGTTMEIMITQQRRDLLMNIPALRKLDTMLTDCLDNFKGPNEFWYVSKDAEEAEKGVKREDKWWLPTIKVPSEGLSDSSRKFLQHQKDCVNQVLKASLAINAQVLSEMEIPDSYIDSLPKNGRATLGDQMYKSITVEYFDPDQFLISTDLSSEHKVLDLKNKIEASIVIWKRKMVQKDAKTPWGSAVSLEKRELFEERAETILLLLKQRFPGLPQSSLDISKIQFNKDVGHSILESYSRVIESLANTVMSRIEDVLYADSATQDPSLATSQIKPVIDSSPSSYPVGFSEDDPEKVTPVGSPNAMTLSDFMGWNLEGSDADMKKDDSTGSLDSMNKEAEPKIMTKHGNIATKKKFSYLDKLEWGGLRSPTERH
ncbi:Rho guanine nucleotide exchange factor 8 [Heracleum sosnowskyi]|uniref:Rho guanine nucleotide exchange factor 8 n=1 Tax=Heracleum sosnowskyi TaxID=360622 RepID=A0AAD8I3Y9_9APIA|nr:Rho guanine nucleotide exchange factor 8 [Heracleum sosnowskyi]